MIDSCIRFFISIFILVPSIGKYSCWRPIPDLILNITLVQFCGCIILFDFVQYEFNLMGFPMAR